MRPRKNIVVEPSDQKRLIAALERGADDGDFVSLRTRAFVYLLWDGALRPGLACALNVDDVVQESRRIVVLEEAVLHPCEATQYQPRSFLISPRARAAIADYLAVARDEGWLAAAGRLKGPLWISTHHHGTQQRMSQRTTTQAWRTFQDGITGLSQKYQLEDFVFSGRVEFVSRVKGSHGAAVLAEHAGISTTTAQLAQQHSSGHRATRQEARDVISQFRSEKKRRS